MKCPNCGAETTSRFCPECGTALGERTCAGCGAKLSARAKFCPDCGTPVPGAARPTTHGPRPTILPWAIAGVSLLAMLVTIVVVVSRGSPSPEQSTMPNAGNARATTDISQMTPQEQAERLFDRVMRAQTAGDTAQVSFFGPMAINAYSNLGALDPDGRLHVGMIQLALNSPEAALAQADSLSREAPSHLFGPLLEARAAEASNDAARARAAYRRFLSAFDDEMAKNLEEYQAHRTDLQAARQVAQGRN